LFSKRDFIYKSGDDQYQCPAGEQLIYRMNSVEKNRVIRRYWTFACKTFPIKLKCTTGKERRVSRWEHEAVVDALQDRMDREPERMKARRETVAHPYGTIKAWMGYTHFQTRTIEKVSTEMSLHVLAYNMKRLISIFGVLALVEAMTA
jgi:hypothetical protein